MKLVARPVDLALRSQLKAMLEKSMGSCLRLPVTALLFDQFR